MAENGMLGKKLVIGLADSSGNVVAKAPEILKWSVEEITQEEKKYPIGEEDEYREVIQMGWKGTIEGQQTSTAMDDIADAKQQYQDQTGDTLSYIIFTSETYRDGTIRKYKYNNVTFDGFKKSADGNNKPITNSINWHSPRRIPL
ncbi:hypothetical protein [Aneurinibacillus terranovensis]|uniref:hypothetical protein n=1 Tax=Aneurinibacillus terranovensis TaxID=278991 RepID=UPI0004030B01|nr:hypothetical protein [Aneurinibacillus terranovensis]